MSENLAYQEEQRDELINGKIVMMSPRPSINHNFVAGNIYRIFGNYLDGKRCVPFADGTDLYLSKTDRVIPDGMVVCDHEKIKQDGVHGAPDLIVEVLSPSTAKNDKGYKKELYAEHGVKEYWIVSPHEKTIEVYLLGAGGNQLDNVYSIYPDFMLEKMSDDERAAVATEFKCSLFDDLVIQLEDVFKRVF